MQLQYLHVSVCKIALCVWLSHGPMAGILFICTD